jgi:sulfite reductase (NADPH) flavoprotein alpha-component
MMSKSIPCVPTTAPFTPEQRAWLNGYLAGLFADANVGEDAQPAPAKKAEPLLVMFGSQTGSAEGLAKRFAKDAEKQGFAPRVLALNDYAKADLAKENRLVIITSTWGDGDPPGNAAACWSWLNSATAPRLENLSFAVLGLGDKNYSDFCGAGKKFDERLVALGAKRLVPRGECDVDYEATAKAWIEGAWPALLGSAGGPPAESGGPPDTSISIQSSGERSVERESGEPPESAREPRALPWSRNNPFPARLKTNRRLNKAGSAKDTRHFEIVLDGGGLSYEVGDALGVMPKNDPVLVEELLATLGCKGEEPVKDAHGQDSTLHEALLSTFVIRQPPPSFVKEAAMRAGNVELLALLEPTRQADFDKWTWGREVIDVLKTCAAAKFAPAEFCGFLRKLQPRLYSISSSPKAHPGEVHLTVGAVRYESHGRTRKGVSSTWLADRVALGETPVPVFMQHSHGFRLPEGGNAPVIMVGPGTGIAPFRAFLEERRATGATGKNWLFFGDQQRAFDFLYEEEFTAWQQDGSLTRLELAFSRDQAEKVYVQDRMREHAGELWSWLEAGAHFYVCGDARRMAKDVDAALHEVIHRAGGKSLEAAAEYVAKLKSEKRYQRDIY